MIAPGHRREDEEHPREEARRASTGRTRESPPPAGTTGPGREVTGVWAREEVRHPQGRRRQQEVPARQRGQRQAGARGEARAERLAERQGRGDEGQAERRLLDLALLVDGGPVERDPEGGEAGEGRSDHAAPDERRQGTGRRTEGGLDQPHHEQVVPERAVRDGQQIGVERVVEERARPSHPVASGDLSGPGVVVLGVQDEPVEERKVAQREHVRRPERRRERHDAGGRPAGGEDRGGTIPAALHGVPSHARCRQPKQAQSAERPSGRPRAL